MDLGEEAIVGAKVEASSEIREAQRNVGRSLWIRYVGPRRDAAWSVRSEVRWGEGGRGTATARLGGIACSVFADAIRGTTRRCLYLNRSLLRVEIHMSTLGDVVLSLIHGRRYRDASESRPFLVLGRVDSTLRCKHSHSHRKCSVQGGHLPSECLSFNDDHISVKKLPPVRTFSWVSRLVEGFRCISIDDLWSGNMTRANQRKGLRGGCFSDGGFI